MEQTLFSAFVDKPLAERLRPDSFRDFVGQKHFVNDRFTSILESNRWAGFIFWGPPGTGKTTLALLVAKITSRVFHPISAVTAGVKEIREILELSTQDTAHGRAAHILFIDEIHRLNKAQQDVLLPFLETGKIRFIGATTENPSFEINNAISSRCSTFHFKPLSEDEICGILEKSKKDFPEIEDGVFQRIAKLAAGDARRALTLLEQCALGAKGKLTLKDIDETSQSQSLYYDKHSEYHYDTISAFIKSIRGSDPDAALFYLARMLEAGEDPLFVARRLIILASEDIGNANPLGLVLASSCFAAVDAIGMPEARIILAQTTTYLACSEKSNRSYVAIEEAIRTAKESGALEIPYHLRNAVTASMKEWGYGKNYQYPHDAPQGWVHEQYLPDKLKDTRFYRPSQHGTEKKIQEFLRVRGKEC